MRLAEKLRHLRQVEGVQRGFGRSLTQAEVVRLMRRELGPDRALSAAYLSQLESGARGHMTERTRHLLADFYRVHPGYLVSDPAGYETDLPSPIAGVRGLGPDRLRGWLAEQAQRWRDDPAVAHLLLSIGRQPDPRAAIETLDALLELPLDRLRAVLDSIAQGKREAAG